MSTELKRYHPPREAEAEEGGAHAGDQLHGVRDPLPEQPGHQPAAVLKPEQKTPTLHSKLNMLLSR